MAMNFLEKYNLLKQDRIQQIDEITRRDKQPDFVHMHSVNGREIAFLGDRPDNPEQFLHHHARIDQIVIPQFAQMVNADKLKEVVARDGLDNKLVAPTEEGLFYSTELDRSIILDIPGMVRPYLETERKFHHCDNFHPKATLRPGLHTLTRGHYFAVCNLAVLAPHFSEDNRLQHKPIMFYLSREDFTNASYLEAEKYRKIHEGDPIDHISISFSVLDKIQIFFLEQDGSILDTPKGLKWDDVIGVFLLPTLAVDKSVVYQCILNVDGERSANQAKSTKENLKEWIDAVECLNDPDEAYEIFVGVNDLFRGEMEEWSCTISKNAYPIVGPRTEIVQSFVLDSVRP